MALEITKVSTETLPALRFIGKRCGDNPAYFVPKWREWFANGWFQKLDGLPSPENIENGYIGLMGCSGTMEDFEYWIGVFVKAGTPVPEGYAYADIPEGIVGVCWLKGREDNGEIFGETVHELCVNKLRENGFVSLREDFKGAGKVWNWFFERYNCPRYTEKDADGEVILDYGVYII